jgi:hypothetical protein
MNEIINIQSKELKIEERIYEIRGKQVMLDSDIAFLFGVTTKRLNEQMKRNIERFPKDFCIQLNSNEFKVFRSQNATFSTSTIGRKHHPYVYTEHGIIALAGVIKSEVAAKMSVEIARKFVQMRKFIAENGDTLLALAKLQNRQLEFEDETNRKFDQVFKRISEVDLPKSSVFMKGRFYDAYEFISELMKKANESLVLIDAYCDSKAFTFIKNKKDSVLMTIYTSKKSKLTDEEIEIFKQQYGDIEIKINNDFHDRYLIIDRKECYSLGASLNRMGSGFFSILPVEPQKLIDCILEIIEEDK